MNLDELSKPQEADELELEVPDGVELEETLEEVEARKKQREEAKKLDDDIPSEV